MMPLYLYVLIGSVMIPLLFSIFIKNLISNWKNFIISTAIVAIIFLVWDVLFTHFEIWTFNPDYCFNSTIFQIPIEEYLFFFVIPFCSLFIHYAFFYVLPQVRLNKRITRGITMITIVGITAIVATNPSKMYTVVSLLFLLVVLVIGIVFHLELLGQFFLTFLIILIPFLIVNGILTGAWTSEPIVRYNDLENLGIRLVTIPVEDVGYAFTLLFANLMIFETLNAKANL